MAERLVTVVTDAGADLPPAAQQKALYGVEPIPQVPLGVTFGDDSYTTDTLSPEQFRRLVLESGHIPKTAALGPSVFAGFYRGLLGGGQQILSLHMGDNISATGNQARAAANEIGEGRIEVFDTGTVSMAQGLLALAAEEMAMTGANRADIVKMLNGLKEWVTLRVITPNLLYLRESGRVSHLIGILGSFLKIIPILQIDQGVVNSVAKPRLMKGALDWMVNDVLSGGVPKRVAILDFEAAIDAQTLAERLIAEAHVPEHLIFRGNLGIITASHGGPGTIAVATVRGGRR